ncbi:acetyl-CoA synthetase-like protein [Polyporus arcularius HHB13444]|uniref:Acetyl-CoA synthetase-like protein n=1 Tax=Polyporus arcularius HHB13444 TaxID=1314778 RepID=A0A5C3PQ13_9APHY|nr:acetyl-CoA synthetase-like protein [Polyporus arcularius HHB13444]
MGDAANHYLSLVIPALERHADDLVFRPYLGRNDDWGRVTYRELEHRLAVTRAYWLRTLAPLQLNPSDVVGFWLTGRKFSDMLNHIAVSSLGYTPQLFGSGDFTDVSVIYELLSKSGGKALVIDPSRLPVNPSPDTVQCPPSHFVPLDDAGMLEAIAELKAAGREDELKFGQQSIAPVRRDDIAAMFHSSGTTGGMPKIIPNTYKMIEAVIRRKVIVAGLLPLSEGQHVINTIGSTAHVASFHIFLAIMRAGGCMVQTSSTAIGVDEFMGMSRVCRLRHLVIFGTHLSVLIRAAQSDDSVKAALRDLYEVGYTGTSMNKEDEEWAHANDIKLTTGYGTTETGPLLRSRRGADPSSRLLRPIPGTNPVFLPYNHEASEGGRELYEIVVPENEDDCPPPPLISGDGYYHTGDLLEKVDDGYVYRGRIGDWIKTVEGFVDTKTIEDTVRKTCADIVHDVVVVGTGQKFPCLIVEAAESGLNANARRSVAKTIVERMTEHPMRLFPHERIQDPGRIIVVDQGRFVRTQNKGNVRRPATEAAFRAELQAIYDTA